MGCIKLSIGRTRKVLKVVKVDGKVMKLTSPLQVKELLVKFEGLGVKSSRKSSKPLPPSFVLQLGKTYHLFPCKSPDPSKNRNLKEVEEKPSSCVKRIKVVITKKQLEELLSKKTSVEKIILGIDGAELSTNWKPNLLAIPEENEAMWSIIILKHT